MVSAKINSLNQWFLENKHINNKYISLCIPGSMSKTLDITGNLYLGTKEIAKNLEVLKDLNIKSIVNVTTGPNYFPKIIKYHKISIKNKPDSSILPYLDDAVKFIKKRIEKGNVLIHCLNGVNRSPSIVIAFIMSNYKINLEESSNYVKLRRKIINEKRFEKDLIKFMETL